MDNCFDIDKKIFYISSCEYEYFLSKENVVGVGLGYKIQNGFNTFKKCIKVFVEKKVSLDKLHENSIVPRVYKGVITDVVECGRFKMDSLTKRIRPVPGGYDIGPIVNESNGTFGCLVTDKDNLYILSNNHVLACENTLSIGVNIVQPSTFFEKADPKNIIGSLSSFIPLYKKTSSKGPLNFSDSAIAKVTLREEVSSKLAILGKIKGTASYKLNQAVQKVGSETEVTTGTISSIGTTMTIDGQFGEYMFTNQIITTKMSQRGDSGSILLDHKMKAVGLIMGSCPSNTVCNPIIDILEGFDVKLVTK